MAEPATVPETTVADPVPTPNQQDSDNPNPKPSIQSDLSSPSLTPFPNPNPNFSAPPPPSIQPSFRPAVPLVPVPSTGSTPLFSPVPTYQNPGVPPPGVSAITPVVMASAPAVGSGALAQVLGAPVQQVLTPPYAMAAQHLRYPMQLPNGYPPIPQHFPQGSMLPPGWKASLETTEYPNTSTPFLLQTLLKVDCSYAYVNQGAVRYPSPYAPMIRLGFPPRPLVGGIPPLARPPIIGIRGPIISPVRPPVNASAAITEKPQTTVYVGKISPTVENDFILFLLQLCGPVKSWKRVQDPTNGTLKGFGFCEFEFAEGVLRAMRLLNKLSVDGQELMLKVNQATRVYLEHYVEKKIESSKTIQGSKTEVSRIEEPTASGSDKNEAVKSSDESVKPSLEEEKKDESEKFNKENPDGANFGIVTDEDMEADREALEKLTSKLDERLKDKPLPPPPPPVQIAVDGPGNSNSDQPSGSRDGESETDVAKHDPEDKNEDEKTGESKLSSDPDRTRTETGSPDRSRRHDKSKDRDHGSRREKEKELERYEREREQERAKREKDREYKSREEERRYKMREKDWETREREREHWRKREREKEKEKSQERKWEIMDQERDGDDGYGKKRKYKTSDEERKRRQREKEEDLADRLREEEDIAEAKMRAEDELQKKQQDAQKIISAGPANGHESTILPDDASYLEDQSKAADQASDLLLSGEIYESEGVLQNGINDETINAATDERQAPTRKLGFGLSWSGKRAAIPSVFNEDEDEDAHKEKKMRPLVPIDYSTEEQQAVQSSISEGPSTNMVAATEYVKRISTVNPKEEKLGIEKEKGRRYHEKSSQRDRGRYEEVTSSTREESRKDHSDRERANKLKTPENQKLLDAKQLIDTIPKTKDELFSYEINWVIYEQNSLHERMRPWISKKITDFLGEEEVTLVDYIVSSTQEHISANEMFERLQTILDDEAEMFVLKMWRMLIFEIKKVETGLAPKAKT